MADARRDSRDDKKRRKRDETPPGMRTYPHNLDAERAVLGGVLLESGSLYRVIELGIEQEDFYRDAHGIIFREMQALARDNKPIDLLTMAEVLNSKQLLEQTGGYAYLADLPQAIPSSVNIEHYAQIVKEKALLRALLTASQEISERVYSGEEDVPSQLDLAEATIFKIAQGRSSNAMVPLSKVVEQTYALLEERFSNRSELTGLTTGYEDLDRMTAGWQPTDLVVLAARPAMGKTALALCFIRNAAGATRDGIAFFSLEMGREQLAGRLLCAEARIDASRFRTGNLEESDWPRLVEAAESLYQLPIFIDDTPGVTVMEVRSKCRRLKAEHGLAFIVVDYLQLMRGHSRTQSREQEISEISRSLKGLAKELHCPVLALSQLNRGVESRADKRPMNSDLRESGAIEQDADMIMFVYRDEVYNEATEDKGVAEVIIGKQRSGSTGTVRLAWLSHFTRFENLVENDRMG